MANVKQVLDNLEGEALYDPEVNGMLPAGTYPAHVKSLNIYERKTRYGSPAQVYAPVYVVAPEAGEHAGTTVHDSGIWRFIADNTDDDTKSLKVGQGNAQYKKLLETFGIVMPVVSNGDGRVLYMLPEVEASDIVGQPVVIDVFHEEWVGRFGEQRKAAKAKIAHAWGDGKHLK